MPPPGPLIEVMPPMLGASISSPSRMSEPIPAQFLESCFNLTSSMVSMVQTRGACQRDSWPRTYPLMVGPAGLLRAGTRHGACMTFTASSSPSSLLGTYRGEAIGAIVAIISICMDARLLTALRARCARPPLVRGHARLNSTMGQGDAAPMSTPDDDSMDERRADHPRPRDSRARCTAAGRAEGTADHPRGAERYDAVQGAAPGRAGARAA